MIEQNERVTALYQHFLAIAHTSMADMPLNHSNITVETIGFRVVHDNTDANVTEPRALLGVLITPWAMNLVWLPTVYQALTQPVGAMVHHEFGDMAFDFIQAFDEALGAYQTCSLESPLESVLDQEQARWVALGVMSHLSQAMANPAKHAGTATRHPTTTVQHTPSALLAPTARPSLSRRRLLTGR